MLQNILKIALSIIAFSIVSFSLLLFYDFMKPHKKFVPTIKPEIDVTLKEIVRLDWYTKLTDIPKIFPGGEIKRQDLKKRTLAFYSIKANLTDIDEIADLSFHQNEEYIRGLTDDAFNLRKLNFECKSIEEQRAKFERLCAHVKSLESKVYTLTNPTHVDASYSISDSDEKGGINITLKMFTHLSKHSVIIDITRFKTIRVIKPNRLKHNKAAGAGGV